MMFRMTLVVVAIVLGVATLICAVLRFSEQSAISPWEPAIAMEAMRWLAGMPVYESAHATHMYGPLLTVFIAAVFQFSGLNLLVARVAMSVFSLALAALLSSVLCRGNNRKYWFLAFVLFLGLSFRTNLVLFSAQPDGAAAFLGVAALCLWIRRKRVRLGLLISIGFFLCAMLFKQTTAAFALVPAVYALVWRRTASAFLAAAIPIIAIAATLGAIDLFWPQVFAGMVSVPASIQVNYARIVPTLLYFIGTFPIFLLAVIAGIVASDEDTEEGRWIWSAIVVLVPVSVWTMCKSGGSYNSLLLGYIAISALVIVRLDSISKWVGSLRPESAVVACVFVAGVMLFSFFVQYHRDLVLAFTRVGNDKYSAVVEYGRRLPGPVVSPQDPTIAYRAQGRFGRALLFELDAHAVNGNWPDTLPESVGQELDQAKFVIQAESYVPTPVFERGLRSRGFQPLAISEFAGSPYTVWEKQDR